MSRDSRIVAAVNSCLNLKKLEKLLSNAEWDRFIKLVNDNDNGRGKSSLVFSGDPTGFHLIGKDGEVTHCDPDEVFDPEDN